MTRKRVGILIFPNVEVLDFCGPFEVFSVTRVNEEQRREESSPFQAILVAETSGAVTATGGMQVLPHHSMADCPHLDILVVPGGWGFRHHMKNAKPPVAVGTRNPFHSFRRLKKLYPPRRLVTK